MQDHNNTYNMVIPMWILSLLFLAPFLHANIVEYDDYWKQRQEEAHAATVQSFEPNPETVTGETNQQVNLMSEGEESERRNLGSSDMGCTATNPIDKCWRCNPKWAENRKRLADCGLGFGKKAIGGKYGEFYVVTDSSDNDMVNPKNGTLRYAVTRNRPLWITFAQNMNIKLAQELIVTGNKTIDGRGADVHISGGAGLMLQFVQNVIVHGIHIHDVVSKSGGTIRSSEDHYGLRGVSDGDAVSIFGSSNIWIDHLTLSNGQDGLVDAIQGSTAITVSNTLLTNHNDVMLFGASDAYKDDRLMQATVVFNHFGQGLVQRMPRCRFGFFHVVNNQYTQWKMYAIGGSQHPTIISEGNHFVAPNDPFAKEITKREKATEAEWMKWTWKSNNDVLENGAIFRQSGPPSKVSKEGMIQAHHGNSAPILTKSAGALVCRPNKPC